MRLSFSDIALHWLRDGYRRDEGWVDVRDGNSALFLERLTFVLDRELARERVDDISVLVADFLALNPRLPDWWQAALGHRGVTIRFEDREPVISVQSFLEWKHLADRLDVDGLVALAYARGYGNAPTRRALDRWGIHPVAEDRWVRRTLGQDRHRLFDLHTHLEGCETALYLWQKVLDSSLKQRHLPEYGRSRLQRLRHAPGREALEHEIDLVFRRAVGAFRVLERLHHARYGPVEPSGPRVTAPSLVSERLWPERVALIRSWQALTASDREGRAAGWDGDQRYLARALDVYLAGKQHFTARQTQTLGGNPGLANFRRFFDRMKITHASRSGRRVWQRRFRLVSTALESPRLNGIELRIAALDRTSEYVRFFAHWEKHHRKELGARLPARAEQPVIAFVAHFIRWRPDVGRVHDPVMRVDRSVDWVDLHGDRGIRAVLDRQSAALHRFRWDHPRLARRLVGIDVANIERLNPVSLFTPYFRLLRGVGLDALCGEAQTPLQVDERLGFENSPYTRSWRRLRDEGRLAPPHDLPRLGLTFHAGEDYHHPLDGVRAIWEVVRRFGAGEGDRLGHALALGDDPARFARVHASGGTVPQGEALDTLVWLHRRMGALPRIDNRVMRALEDEIAALCARIYGRGYPIAAFQLVQQLKHRPYLQSPVGSGRWFTDAGREEMELYRRDNLDERVRAQRSLNVGLPRIYFDLTMVAELSRVVDEVLRLVESQRVTIEVNPTSNVCVGGYDRYSDHPVFRIVRRNQKIRFVICCDDPGTFATRIENEYAAMLDAIRDLDEDDRDVARRAVEAAVATAQAAAFDEGW